jgi:predicted GNAT family acetyltransferase
LWPAIATHSATSRPARARGQVGELTYRRPGPARILIDHTEVSPHLRGRGVARQLLDAAVAWARVHDIRIGATCSYVLAQFARDSSLHDVRADARDQESPLDAKGFP